MDEIQDKSQKKGNGSKPEAVYLNEKEKLVLLRTYDYLSRVSDLGNKPYSSVIELSLYVYYACFKDEKMGGYKPIGFETYSEDGSYDSYQLTDRAIVYCNAIFHSLESKGINISIRGIVSNALYILDGVIDSIPGIFYSKTFSNQSIRFVEEWYNDYPRWTDIKRDGERRLYEHLKVAMRTYFPVHSIIPSTVEKCDKGQEQDESDVR